MTTKKRSILRLRLYVTLIISGIVFVVGGVLSTTKSGGEQILMQTFAWSIMTALATNFLISGFNLGSSIVKGIKPSRGDLMIFVIFGILLFPLAKALMVDSYDIVEGTYKKGDKQGEYRLEYYPVKGMESPRLRSERYWLEDKKDSVWKIYDRNGSVVSIELYNGSEKSP